MILDNVIRIKIGSKSVYLYRPFLSKFTVVVAPCKKYYFSRPLECLFSCSVAICIAAAGSLPSFLFIYLFPQCFINLAVFVFICEAGSALSLTRRGREWHFSAQTICCLICAVLVLVFCSCSWCNSPFSWCNCCSAYLVGSLGVRDNQAAYLADLHRLPLVTKDLQSEGTVR